MVIFIGNSIDKLFELIIKLSNDNRYARLTFIFWILHLSLDYFDTLYELLKLSLHNSVIINQLLKGILNWGNFVQTMTRTTINTIHTKEFLLVFTVKGDKIVVF